MVAVYIVNWCVLGAALVVGLLVALSWHGWLDFQVLTGVGAGRAAVWVVVVLIWTGPLAMVSMLAGDDSAKSGAVPGEAGDDAATERRGDGV